MRQRNGVLAGQRFGRLIVLGVSPTRRRGHVYVNCRCECGTAVLVGKSNLTTGHTQSCGCLNKELTAARFVQHGERKSPEYPVWNMMIQRCSNPRCTSWANYGGRGIAVCEQWRASFVAFLSDMGHRPSSAHTLERLDNDRGYEPGNVVWATRAAQSRNRRSSRQITYNGETLCLTDWAKRTGLDDSALRARLNKGWPIAKALQTPSLKESR